MLQQMKQAAAGKGGGGGSSGGESGDEDGGGGEGDQEGRDDVQIPLPADFRTPEEYRKALLEGMRGDVPEEYRALNRRYYEELVRQ
jgi:hypothetical protein